VTLLKTGCLSFLIGAAIALIGAKSEVQAIYRALTPRLRTGIGFMLGGIAIALVGLRLGGQNVFRRITGRHRGFPYIEW
jgi:hypothetical protein